MSLNASSGLQRLLDAPVRPGRLLWIGLRRERRGPIDAVEAADLSPEKGLHGDRYGGRNGGKRQFTLIAMQDLAAVASFLGRDEPYLPAALVRRNLVVSGLNLIALKGHHLAIGAVAETAVILKVTGELSPVFTDGGAPWDRGLQQFARPRRTDGQRHS